MIIVNKSLCEWLRTLRSIEPERANFQIPLHVTQFVDHAVDTIRLTCAPLACNVVRPVAEPLEVLERDRERFTTATGVLPEGLETSLHRVLSPPLPLMAGVAVQSPLGSLVLTVWRLTLRHRGVVLIFVIPCDKLVALHQALGIRIAGVRQGYRVFLLLCLEDDLIAFPELLLRFQQQEVL